MSDIELNYYATMIQQDEIEEEEKSIEQIEYLALFTNPKMVREMRKDREDRKNGKSDGSFATQTDEEFEANVEKLFDLKIKKPGK